MDNLEGNPKIYRDDSYIRLLEKSNKILTVVAMVSTAGFVGTVSAILALFPLKKTEQVFVTFNKEEQQIVRLIPYGLDKTTLEQLTDNYLREYVRKRETINHVDEADRSEWIRLFTNEAWFDFYRNTMSFSNPESPVLKYAKEGLSREAHVISILRSPENEAKYQIEFFTIDRRQGFEINRREYVSTLTISYRDLIGSPEVTAVNPIGLTVESYVISERINPLKEQPK